MLSSLQWGDEWQEEDEGSAVSTQCFLCCCDTVSPRCEAVLEFCTPLWIPQLGSRVQGWRQHRLANVTLGAKPRVFLEGL